MPLNATHFAQLAIWTKKFALPLCRLNQTSLQKITATDNGELVLSVYKPQDDRSLIILSTKKGESGLWCTHERPVTLKKPNSFTQISRKYLQNRKITAAYASISPICLILEFAPLSLESEENKELNEGPNCLLLDLDNKPPRLILAKKTNEVPTRYKKECEKNFLPNDAFFESWCEWSQENTKTKKRAAFLSPFVGYCPLLQEPIHFIEPLQEVVQNHPEEIKNEIKFPKINTIKNEILDEDFNLNSALTFLPTHIRRSARTKYLFFERRLHRQKNDLPSDNQLNHLKKQSENLKAHLYLWPENSLTWYVPPQLIEEMGLNPIYTLKKGEKPSSILLKLYHEINVLERRKQELTKRMIESEKSLEQFQNLIIQSAQDLKTEGHSPEVLCQYLDIELTQGEQTQKIKNQQEKRLPYRSFTSSTGQFIRVARSSVDGDSMIKLMPTNHTWLHVLTGEGSHVWLEKGKGEKKVSPIALREAGILATHYSKHSRSQQAEIQYTNRADIEKKKNLPPGKVLVRRCETFVIKYNDEELSAIINGNQNSIPEIGT